MAHVDSSNPLPRIVITPGEPAGIGPDVVLMAAQKSWNADLVCIADRNLLPQRAGELGLDVELLHYTTGDTPQASQPGQLRYIHVPATTSISAGKLEIENALKRYHVYFPEQIVPQVATLISGFAYPIVVTDSVLGIGLEMYMGSDFTYYEMMRVPLFRRNRMTRKSLVKDAMKGWLQSEFIDETGNKTFLQQIIHQGKMFYALKKVLPETPPEIIIGYSTEQWDWCTNHEKAMWGHFVNKKLFYSTLFNEYHKFISEGPFTAAFTRESPDQTGFYMGWQIVNSYMENNPNVSLNELMINEDSKQILAQSGYKPRK